MSDDDKRSLLDADLISEGELVVRALRNYAESCGITDSLEQDEMVLDRFVELFKTLY